MADNNWPDETETKDDNNENGIRKLNLKQCYCEILKLPVISMI